MIIYFADRGMRILGNASTHLPDGLKIAEDNKIEDVESGVASFECYLPYTKATRAKLEKCAEAGNYILRSNDDETDFFTIVEMEIDTKSQEIYVYAEDAGLDLLNDIVGAYEADKEYPISHYISKFAYDAGFKVKTNEVSGLTRKLKFDAEETATARIASVAAQFGAEIAYSFKIKGLKIVNKYINIYENRGSDNGIQLRLNRDIDKIVTTKSIANIATALQCEGDTPDDAEEPITLSGYTYDDGDFFVSDGCLYSRKAVQTWGRYVWEDEPNQILGDCGHIVKQFSSDTTSQETLCKEAIAELKRLREVEVNFEVDISKLPDNVKVGDRVYIIDEAGELYLSTRILKLEHSVTKQKHSATLGEFLIKSDGIAKSVKNLAEKFAKQTVSVKNAKKIATAAKEAAETATTQAEAAATAAATAQTKAEKAAEEAEKSAQAANNAEAEALAAKAAVEKVEDSITNIETTVNNAQEAAQQAQQAAAIAQEQAGTAAEAANNAATNASEAIAAAGEAQAAVGSAMNKAEVAEEKAETAKSEAAEAAAIAIAAKIDAEQAGKDVDALGDKLETVSRTMKTDYTRKTDLTDTTAELQTQITQNAAKLESTAYKNTIIDETANNAASKLDAARNAANEAQAAADEAAAEAITAQQAATAAQEAANNAQAEADIAQAAYEEAKSVADKAEADLIAAQKDLATVEARAEATEEEIAAAQQAVAAAQITADNAKQAADAAAILSENALNTANAAVQAATKAQAAADNAVNKAELAQEAADEAKGDADAVQAIVDNATITANNAQAVADEAKATADTAQAAANEAHATATAAQETAEAAQEILRQASADLATAELRLEEVLADVEATEEAVTAAQADVATAQAAVDEAEVSANNAQTAADTAQANADSAQAAANEAKAVADSAQAAADEAQRAVEEAQGYVYALAKRMTEAETKITQTADEIALTATKTEVAEYLSGYSTKKEMEAAIAAKADEISLSVSSTEKANSDNTDRITTLESKIQLLEKSISMFVVGENNGTVLVQTEDGWSFDMGAIKKEVESLTKELGIINSRVVIGENEQGQPIIELKVLNEENETSNFKAEITNTGIHFYEGTTMPASIEDGVFNMERAVVKEELQQGGFVWLIDSEDNLCLCWRGE